MKEITAYIKAPRLPAVLQALHKMQALDGLSFWEIRGFGAHRPVNGSTGIIQDLVGSAPYVRLETFCPDELEFEVVTLIQRAAWTGNPGDGKIFVTRVERAVRISTEEEGEAAFNRWWQPR
ncbi:MAG: P-II family nitrogen regulator [Verrucomicrobia bacterium]|nr:P-II family nitrogen regulator [Verrucomicrobiota bacterium]